ncbi:MAG TPA: glycoside hydrolase family 36 protein [Armatimonadota bacterium]|jgi:alpha-galactosidase
MTPLELNAYATADSPTPLPADLTRLAHEGWEEFTVRVSAPSPARIAEAGVRLQLSAEFVGPRVGQMRVFKHNWQSWGATYSLSLEEPDFRANDPINRSWTRNTPAEVPPGEIESDGFILLRGTDGQHLLLGWLTAFRYLGAAVLTQTPTGVELEVFQATENAPLAAGETLELEPLGLWTGADPSALLAAYADEVARRMGARVPDHTPVGWNPYYFYYCKDTIADFRANARCLAELQEQLPVRYLSTDEGPSPNRGDWFAPSARYPEGVAEPVRIAHDLGLDPGIWWTPFCVSPDWPALAEHPDWLLRDASGQPVPVGISDHTGPYLPLDASHPGVLEFLRATTRRYMQMGVKLLKIDFCYAGALPGVHHDPTATRVTALRQGLQVIREECGDQALILGCGMPLQPAVGLVDLCRIGQDFQPYWYAPRGDKNLFGRDMPHRNILTRSFLHRRWFLADPDCLSIRQDETELTETEARSSLHIVGLSGGPLFYSDRLPTLSPERLDWYSFAGPPPVWREGPTPLDLLEGETPTITLAAGENYWVLLLYNPQAEEQTITAALAGHLPAGEYVAWEPLAPQIAHRCGPESLTLSLPVPAHGTRLLRLTPRRPYPFVVGDTVHISQGAALGLREDYHRESLLVSGHSELRRHGAVYVYDPARDACVALPFTGPGHWSAEYPGEADA